MTYRIRRSNDSDLRRQMDDALNGLESISSGMTTLVDAPTIAWDMAQSYGYTLTLTASRTMDAPTNVRPGTSCFLIVKQGGAGNYTVTWNAVFNWASNIPPVLSTAVGAVDVLTFYVDDVGALHGLLTIKGSA